jgi:GntR family transcriptional regulator of gluconate operon
MPTPIGSPPSTALTFRDRWEVVYEELRARILSGDMPAGSQIRETEIAETFGVSRGPVREAIRALQGVGLVVRGPRQPSYVAPVAAQDVDEVYSLREAIEVLAVKLAMVENGEEMRRVLPDRVVAFERAVHSSLDNAAIVEADIAFHSTFYDAAGNRRLSAVWASMTDPLRSMMRLALHREDPHWRSSFESHAEIAEAAMKGDVNLTIRLVRDHLSAGRADLITFVNAQEYVTTRPKS